MPPHSSEGVRFSLGCEELPTEIMRLRSEGVDLVIVLSHLGFPQDVQLAKSIKGIDVLVSGRTHNRLRDPFVVNGIPIIQSGCHGSFIGRLNLRIANGRFVGWDQQI